MSNEQCRDARAHAAATKRWRERNPEKVRALKRAHYAKNPEKYRAINRRRYERHGHKYLAGNRRYRQEHRAEITAWKRNYRRTRYATDPVFKLTRLVSRRVRAFLAQAGYRKDSGTFEMVGCSPAFLRKHIEARFQPGMTWENYGSAWQIDHAKPLKSARTKRELLRLFHYMNLQPLWTPVNLAKAAKTPTQMQLL